MGRRNKQTTYVCIPTCCLAVMYVFTMSRILQRYISPARYACVIPPRYSTTSEMKDHCLMTAPSRPPSTPLTLFGFSRTHVMITAALAANKKLSLHCFSIGYRLGTIVASARGATNRAMSFLLLAVSMSTLQPQRAQPVPTQRPPSMRCRLCVSLPTTCGPTLLRPRQTP